MTNLPEPNFIDRDADTIVQEWIEKYEEKSGKVLQPAQIERLMIDLGAYRETVLRNKIQEIAKENLLSYAPLEVLVHIGDQLGVTQLLADCAKTTLEFSVSDVLDFDFVIPAGTEVETKDGLYIFQTTEDGILKANTNSVQIPSQCETAGLGANGYILGAINNLITPLKYINEVKNTVVSYGGADDEEADSFRERIRQAPEKFTNAGSRGAYKYHTFSAHQSIIDVTVTSPSPGYVNIYPLTDTGNPSNEILEEVKNILSDEKVRPLTDYVQVFSPEKIDFSINATLTLYLDSDADTVMKTINSRIQEFKETLSSKLGKNIVKTQIITLLNSTYGVFKVDLTAPEDINIKENQWANLKDFNISIGGYADE